MNGTSSNQTEDDISQLFELYDKVFNISESTSESDPAVVDDESPTGVTQEQLRFNTSDMVNDTLNTNEYQQHNTTVIIEENEKESKTDALLIESVEKIGDAEVQKEFIKEVETVQQSFGDDVSDEDSNKKNVSVSPIDDLSGYVIEENENPEPFINYNAMYEEKIVADTTELNLDSNDTTESLTLFPEVSNKSESSDKEFQKRRIEQVLEARISSIIFGESFADEDNNLNNNETNIDDDDDSTDEIMIAMESNLEHGNQTWNVTMVCSISKPLSINH